MAEQDTESYSDMQLNPQRVQALTENISHVLGLVSKAGQGKDVRMIAVSKLKPANDILALHQASPSQIHFGENYAQELTEKAAILPRSIKWHMIGALQSNKCKPLAEQIPNLWCVSSVDSVKKADQLEKGRALLADKTAGLEQLRVLVQINTSGEESKSGVEPQDATELSRHIVEHCPLLKLAGFMTIGAIARSKETTPETENEDFVKLRETRDKVANDLDVEAASLDLSMGMSSDFEGAIAQGSDEVRIGTTIFGERPARKDAKVKEDVAEEKP